MVHSRNLIDTLTPPLPSKGEESPVEPAANYALLTSRYLPRSHAERENEEDIPGNARTKITLYPASSIIFGSYPASSIQHPASSIVFGSYPASSIQHRLWLLSSIQHPASSLALIQYPASSIVLGSYPAGHQSWFEARRKFCALLAIMFSSMPSTPGPMPRLSPRSCGKSRQGTPSGSCRVVWILF